MTPFKLEIITPDGVFFDGETENVIVRTTVGDKGILARHEPYAAALPTGKLRVMVDGEYYTAAVSAGVVKVNPDKTTILVQSCEWAKRPKSGYHGKGPEIDLERAEKARKAAEERLADPAASANELAMAEFKLKRALNRISSIK